MKVKVAGASDQTLDWLVGMALGYELNTYGVESIRAHIPGQGVIAPWRPSSNWSQGGPIIEREELHWGFGGMRDGKRNCMGQKRGYWQKPTLGPTPLIAAMRCLVTSRLGEEVEVPDELFLEKHQ